MARIQDIKQFEELIYDTVDEYLQEMDCYDHPVLAIWREDGEHQVIIDEPSNIPLSDDMEQYELDDLIFQTDATPEPNLDRISEIANEWIFPDWHSALIQKRPTTHKTRNPSATQVPAGELGFGRPLAPRGVAFWKIYYFNKWLWKK